MTLVNLEASFLDAALYLYCGQIKAGRPILEQTVVQARNHATAGNRGDILLLAARFSGALDEWDMALSQATESAWAFEEVPDSEGALRARGYAGLAYVNLGLPQKGRPLLEQALHEVADVTSEAALDVRCWMGQALKILDDPASARAYLQEAYSRERPATPSLLFRHGMIALLLAGIAVDGKDWGLGAQAAETAALWFQELGHMPYWISALGLHAIAMIGLEQWMLAGQSLQQIGLSHHQTEGLVVDSNMLMRAAAVVSEKCPEFAHLAAN